MRRNPLIAFIGMAGALLGGCATGSLEQAGSLQSYDSLVQSDGLLTRSKLRVDKTSVTRARTVKIVPTAFSVSSTQPSLTPAQRSLVANAIDRAMCGGLSERFVVVTPSEPADLTVRALVTQVAPTDVVSAGVSRGASVAKSILLPGVPVPLPRIPVGMGSISLEAEARDAHGKQQAAMVWGRGANAFLTSARLSEESDAYTLASDFGSDFSKMLVTGETPFGKAPTFPSFEQIGAQLGGDAKYAACRAFGPSPGLIGLVGGSVGVPPSWTDKGAVVAVER
ncbi:uncharacterized protein DUF3313 [Bosea psychrotolerans]|uniref:Uncharacterized protein DUF3313 n=2 Tax=Bosea psychrotolerans TaxID=1871628 RepID=A0A2S4M0F2_9HYPH|nr:uncharacterized protein DUF3313 [Bosea psychrotolerans]